MKKRLALSPMGMGIVAVIAVALLMIISAPFIIDENKKSDGANSFAKNSNYSENVNTYNEVNNVSQTVRDVQSKMRNMDMKLADLEAKMEKSSENTQSKKSSSSKRYSCTLESALDADGETIELTRENYNDPTTKYVFVCSKK